jgi:hypothetical protein
VANLVALAEAQSAGAEQPRDEYLAQQRGQVFRVDRD